MDERTFKRTLRRTVTVPVAVLILRAVALVVEILLLSSALRGVDHEDQVIADARALMRYLVDMESAIRGWPLQRLQQVLQTSYRVQIESSVLFPALSRDIRIFTGVEAELLKRGDGRPRTPGTSSAAWSC